ncbi:MAG: outer membrane lipoprotein carrier protein LolA [Verrucomicrobiae bacterium]
MPIPVRRHPRSAFLRCLAALAAMFLGGATSAAPPDLSPLKEWIARQKNVRSVSADFTQTRALSALRSPLTSTGRLWFVAPDWFRWELGDPPKIIIIGTPKGLTTIQPGRNRAERKPASPSGSLADSGPLGMIRFPGGGSFEEFQRLVQVLAFESTGSRCHLEMLPRDARSARRLAAIKLDFDPATGHWLSFEIVTREGSSIRNEFRNVRINPRLDKELFEYDLTGFHVTDEKD